MFTNFQTKQATLNFWAQICPKMDFGVKNGFLGSEFQKSKSGFNTSNIPCVPIFSQNGQHFDLNLENLPNYVQYFSSNIVEGVAESWVEV